MQQTLSQRRMHVSLLAACCEYIRSSTMFSTLRGKLATEGQPLAGDVGSNRDGGTQAAHSAEARTVFQAMSASVPTLSRTALYMDLAEVRWGMLVPAGLRDQVYVSARWLPDAVLLKVADRNDGNTVENMVTPQIRLPRALAKALSACKGEDPEVRAAELRMSLRAALVSSLGVEQATGVLQLAATCPTEGICGMSDEGKQQLQFALTALARPMASSTGAAAASSQVQAAHSSSASPVTQSSQRALPAHILRSLAPVKRLVTIVTSPMVDVLTAWSIRESKRLVAELAEACGEEQPAWLQA